MTDAHIDRNGPVLPLDEEALLKPVDEWSQLADIDQRYIGGLKDVSFEAYYQPEPTVMVDPDEAKERHISERVRELQALLDIPAGIKQKLDGIQGLDPIYGVLIFVTREEFDRLEDRM